MELKVASELFLTNINLTVKQLRRCLDASAKQEVEATLSKSKQQGAFRNLILLAGEGNGSE